MKSVDTLMQQLKKEQLSFMRARDSESVSRIRYLMSLINERAIELRPSGQELTSEDIFKILKRVIKRLKQSIDIYEKAGKSERVAMESAELHFYEDLAAKLEFDL